MGSVWRFVESAWQWLGDQLISAWDNERFAILVVLFVILVRFSGRWFSRGQLRRVKWFAGPRRWSRYRRTGVRAELPCRRCRKHVYRDLRTTLTLVQNGTPPPVTQAAQRLCVPCGDCDGNHLGTEDRPFATRRFAFVIGVVAEALEPRSSTLLGRYLLPDRTQQNDDYLARLLSYLRRFEDLEQVGFPETKRAGDVLAYATSAITGAVVLADVSGTRARCFDRIAVWHRGNWRGRLPERAAAPKRRRAQSFVQSQYEQNTAAKEVRDLLASGDYNGRVPVLAYADVRQHPGAEGATLVMITDETDYASTEPPRSQSGTPARAATEQEPGTSVPTESGSPRREETNCKKLPWSVDREHAALFALLPGTSYGADSSPVRPIGAVFREGERAPLVNGKLCLVSDGGEEPALVLMQRSKSTSNGAGVLGPTAGGVLELSVAGDSRDSDDSGAVDVLAGTVRELGEELGLQPDDVVVETSCAFLSNSTSRPVARNSSTEPRGEVLCTVLATGRTALGPEEFARRRYRASPSKGRYESDGLLFVPMGECAQDFAAVLAESLFVPGEPTTHGPGTAPPKAVPIKDFLEQSALVGAVYAAAMIFGVPATIAAFSSAFGGIPWWADPWPDGTPRLVHDPQYLIANADGDSSPLPVWVAEVFGSVLDYRVLVDWSGLRQEAATPEPKGAVGERGRQDAR